MMVSIGMEKKFINKIQAQGKAMRFVIKLTLYVTLLLVVLTAGMGCKTVTQGVASRGASTQRQRLQQSAPRCAASRRIEETSTSWRLPSLRQWWPSLRRHSAV